MNILLTMLCGYLVGEIFRKLKVTGGMMIGALVGSAIFNILTNDGYIAFEMKFMAQVITGAFVGCSMKKEDLKSLKYLVVPLIFVTTCFLILNLVVGYLIHNLCGIDKATAYMSAVPGGISDIPMIAVDLGANPSKVATMQFARLVTGVALFPTIIKLIDKRNKKHELSEKEEVEEVVVNKEEIIAEGSEKVKVSAKKKYDYRIVVGTLIIATIGGIMGKELGISGGVVLVPMVLIATLQIKTEKIVLPPNIRKFAQLLSGSFIGSTMVWADVIDLKSLAMPILIMIIGYFINCVFLGFVLHKRFGFSLAEGMLTASPAGPSDLALIADEMGIESARLAVMQMSRMTLVIAIFPQVISFLL